VQVWDGNSALVGSEVCGMQRARFLKFVRGGFKTCGAGVDKKIQPAQDSNAHLLHMKGNQSRTLITGALRVEVVQSHRPGISRTPRDSHLQERMKVKWPNSMLFIIAKLFHSCFLFLAAVCVFSYFVCFNVKVSPVSSSFCLCKIEDE